ncbi:hypothetical protein Aduo_012452 [Ancylostoma duodenale]
MLHFGVSDAMSKFMEDLRRIVTGCKPQPELRSFANIHTDGRITGEGKNKPENIILAGVMFTSKNPNEKLLDRLAQELVDLKVSGITVKDDNGWSEFATRFCAML